jgi:O-glycosyl hydrolase
MKKVHSTVCKCAIFVCLGAVAMFASAQQPIALAPGVPATYLPADGFQFTADGPASPGWGRNNQIARRYFPEYLPTFFSRTLAIDKPLPANGRLLWIFTGPRGGFTIEISQRSITVSQRFYDSYGLRESDDLRGFPSKAVQQDTAYFSGVLSTVTVIVDHHLSLTVKLNGVAAIEQSFLLDVFHHQLEFDAPRSEHVVVSGGLLPIDDVSTTVQVDPTQTFQTMLGFGGSPSIPAYESLSADGKKEYWKLLENYNLLIDREYPMGARLEPDMSNLDNMSDASPHYYGDNFPNGEVSSFSYNQNVVRLGGKVLYEMWDLPSWAKKDYVDKDGKVYKGAADPAQWVKAMMNYVHLEKERTGAAPDILGIQNEVVQPSEITYEMVRSLRDALDREGFQDVAIQMPDASFTRGGISAANILSESPDVWKSIDYAAAHEYDFQDYLTDCDGFDHALRDLHKADEDKKFISTEICVNSPKYQIDSYRVAFNVGQLYHKNLTILNSVGLLYCWLILDVEEPSYGQSRSLMVPDRLHGNVPAASGFELRVLGAFSRRVKEGMRRVFAASTNPDLLVSAFESNGGRKTVIALNRSTSPQTLTVSWPGANWTVMERASQYAENEPEAVPASILIQPGEIVTLSTVVSPTTDK